MRRIAWASELRGLHAGWVRRQSRREMKSHRNGDKEVGGGLKDKKSNRHSEVESGGGMVAAFHLSMIRRMSTYPFWLLLSLMILSHIAAATTTLS